MCQGGTRLHFGVICGRPFGPDQAFGLVTFYKIHEAVMGPALHGGDMSDEHCLEAVACPTKQSQHPLPGRSGFLSSFSMSNWSAYTRDFEF